MFGKDAPRLDSRWGFGALQALGVCMILALATYTMITPSRDEVELPIHLTPEEVANRRGDALVAKQTARVVCLSDTHGRHNNLANIPDGDILIHAGDFSVFGSPYDIANFNKWLGALPHKHKFVIAGNHEASRRYSQEPFTPRLRKMITNAVYLEDSGATVSISGETLHIWGSPWQPQFTDFDNFVPRNTIAAKWALIPNNTDILVTHTPPGGRGDGAGSNRGCFSLRQTVQRVRPKLSVFGHIHSGHGVSAEGPTMFVNAALSKDESYKLVFTPTVVDINLGNRGVLDVAQSVPNM